MCYLSKWFPRLLLLASLLATPVGISAQTVNSCDFLQQLTQFDMLANAIVSPDSPPSDERLRNMQRQIQRMIDSSEGAVLTSAAGVGLQVEKDFLENYQAVMIQFLGTLQYEGVVAARSIVSSQKFLHYAEVSETLSQKVNCDSLAINKTSSQSQETEAPNRIASLTSWLPRDEQGQVPSEFKRLIFTIAAIIFGTVLSLLIYLEIYSKRSAVRYPCDQRVRISGKFGVFAAHLHNISLSGAGVEVEAPVRRGDRICIHFPGGRYVGCVKWVGPDMIGVKFRSRLRKLPDFVKTSSPIFREKPASSVADPSDGAAEWI